MEEVECNVWIDMQWITQPHLKEEPGVRGDEKDVSSQEFLGILTGRRAGLPQL